jgi:hypothetical protein
MGKVQKLNSSVSPTPSSEAFVFYLFQLDCLADLLHLFWPSYGIPNQKTPTFWALFNNFLVLQLSLPLLLVVHGEIYFNTLRQWPTVETSATVTVWPQNPWILQHYSYLYKISQLVCRFLYLILSCLPVILKMMYLWSDSYNPGDTANPWPSLCGPL